MEAGSRKRRSAVNGIFSHGARLGGGVNPPDRYAVFGNPVKHSLSPQIHAAFAAQCEQHIHYRAVQVAEGEFASATRRFFEDGGCGLNVTVPYKREAWELADELSPRAQRAGRGGFWGTIPMASV